MVLRRIFHTALIGIAIVFSTPGPRIANALENPGENLQPVGVHPTLGEQVDLSISLIDSKGTERSLGEILKGSKPVVLVPVYYSCPRLCGLTLSGVVKLLREVELKLGRDYRVISVSFDPTEGPELAAKREDSYHEQLAQALTPGAWEFFVGKEGDVTRLMDQIGFRYKKDGDEFAHSSAIIVLTAGGKISQYFTGIDFSPWDVRLALIDASQGAVGSAIDHVLLYCFRFDPTKGKYTLAAMNVMKLGGILSMVGLGIVVFLSARRA